MPAACMPRAIQHLHRQHLSLPHSGWCERCKACACRALTAVFAHPERYGPNGVQPRMQTLWQDLRYGIRILRKQPAFAILALPTCPPR